MRRTVLAGMLAAVTVVGAALPATSAAPEDTTTVMKGVSSRAVDTLIAATSDAGTLLRDADSVYTFVAADGTVQALDLPRLEYTLTDDQLLGLSYTTNTWRVASIGSDGIGPLGETVPIPHPRWSHRASKGFVVAVGRGVDPDSRRKVGVVASAPTTANGLGDWSHYYLPPSFSPTSVTGTGFVGVTETGWLIARHAGQYSEGTRRIDLRHVTQTTGTEQVMDSPAGYADIVTEAQLGPSGAVLATDNTYTEDTGGRVGQYLLNYVPYDGGPLTLWETNPASCPLPFGFGGVWFASTDIGYVWNDPEACDVGVATRRTLEGALLDQHEVSGTVYVSINESNTLVSSWNGTSSDWQIWSRTGDLRTTVEVPKTYPHGRAVVDGQLRVLTGANLGIAGLYEVHADGSTDILHPSDPKDAQAKAMALSKSRVVWADDRNAPAGTWSRDLSGATGAPQLGAESPIDFEKRYYWLDASDTVVASVGASGLQVQGPAGYLRMQGFLDDVDGSLVLSTRLLPRGARLRLIDASTGQTTIIPEEGRVGRWVVTLAGDDVISAVGHRSVRLYEPDTGVETVLARFSPEQMDKFGFIDATSKYAAWTIRRRNHAIEERVVDLYVYNLRSHTLTLAPQGKALIQDLTVGPDWVTFIQADRLKAVPLRAPKSTSVLVNRFSGAAEIEDVAGDVVAWLDAKDHPKVTRFAVLSSSE